MLSELVATTTPQVAEAAVQRRYPGLPFGDPSRRQRLIKVGAWLVGIALALVVLRLLGVDVIGWLSDLWDQIKAIPVGYIIAGLAFQTAQTFFAGLSYYGILRAAYPGQVELWPIVTAYAVAVADERLPAREHRHARDAGDVHRDHSRLDLRGLLAAYVVQRLFFTSRAPSSTSTSSCLCRARSP